VRFAAAWNRNATEQVLLVAVRDEDWEVRYAAAWNPSATEQVLLAGGAE
jgi:hypothetical protein